jgi:tubulin polyglutamylase TTLL1
MIDDQFKTYLIEVNTNPCYELSSNLLARIIPCMIENAIRIAVDPIFPPPAEFNKWNGNKKECIPENIL